MTDSPIYLARPGALEKLEAKLANLQAEHVKMKAARREFSRLPLLNYWQFSSIGFPGPSGEGTRLYPVTVMRKGRYHHLPSRIKRTRVPTGCQHRVRWIDGWIASSGLKYTGPVFLSDSRVRFPGEENVIEGPEITAKQLSNSKKQIHSVRERIEIVKERRG